MLNWALIYDFIGEIQLFSTGRENWWRFYCWFFYNFTVQKFCFQQAYKKKTKQNQLIKININFQKVKVFFSAKGSFYSVK